MQSTITLTITTGQLAGKTYTFDQGTTFIIGRNDDCHLCVPDEFYKGVSRYHCSLNINPPQITIKDLGSLNGTYVNYQKIGQRDRSNNPNGVDSLDLPEYELKNEDEIIVGDIVLQVKVEEALSIKAVTEMIEFSQLKSQIQSQPEPQVQKPKVKSVATQHQYSEISDIAKNLNRLAGEGNKDLQLISKYQIVKMVGKSSFSEVYVVEHKPTGKLAALKLIIPTINIDKSRIQIFSHGIENIQAVKHPNIANILGYGCAENVFFILMKYYKLGNVCNLMNHFGGKIKVPMSVGIIMQVLDGLNHAHNAEIPYSKLANNGRFDKGIGLFHLYLKPENILLSHVNRKLKAKIADYGLANSFYLAGLSGQAFTKIKKEGQPSFVPRPQVTKFRDFKADVDVWAAAACLYYMLTGYIPRDFGEEPWLDILQNDPVPIRQRNDSIPVELAKVIDLALVEKPQIYFQSAAQFKQALKKAISNI